MEQKTPHRLYFEGILQVREPTDQVIDFIYNQIEKQKKEWIKITKISYVRNGIDFNLTSKKYLRTLGKKLQANFGGTVKEAPQLFSRDHQTGKDIYRLNVSFRPSSFKKNDIIERKTRVYKILSFAKEITAEDLETRKKTTIKFKEPIKLIEPIYKTIASKIKPQIEVLDPDTFQSVPTKNTATIKHGEKVKVVKYKGNFWLV